jgi:hypothetical protein
MKPQSDGFVDAEVIAKHRVRLVDAAAERAYLFAHADTAREPAAPKGWSRWAGQLLRFTGTSCCLQSRSIAPGGRQAYEVVRCREITGPARTLPSPAGRRE